MAYDVWPISLPQDFLLSGYSYAMGDGRIRSKMDTGPDKIRLRTANMPDSIKGSFVMNGAQLKTLETFIRVTLIGGSLPFLIRDPNSYQLSGHRAKVTFRDLPDIKPHTPNLFNVSFTLDKLETLPPPAPAFSPEAVPAARDGVEYRWTPTIIEGTKPYRGFTLVTGTLPAGMEFNSETGTITGTPRTAGTYNFNLQVVDDDGRVAARSVAFVVRHRGWIYAGERGSRVAIDPVLTRNSTATYFGIDGLLKTAAANEPRFEYDPINSRYRGVLIEEARTNVITNGTLPGSGSGWTLTAATRTIVPGAGIDGGDAVQITEGSNTGEHRIGFGVTSFPANSTTDFWHSCLVKLGPGSAKTWIYAWCGSFANMTTRSNVYFNLATGEVGRRTGAGDFEARIEPVGNGWYRIYLKGQTLNTTTGNVGFWVNIVSADNASTAQEVGDGYSSILTQYWQSEVGLFPTSIIPSGSGEAIRAGEQFVFNNGWADPTIFNPFGSSIAVKFQTFDPFASRRPIDRSGGNNGVIVQANAPSSSTGRMMAQIPTSGSSGMITYNAINNFARTMPGCMAYTFDMTSSAMSVNGLPVQSGIRPEGTPAGTANNLNIGWSTILGNGGQLNGWIEKVDFIPRRVTDDELRELSAL